jgi:hypothetical protein
MPKPILRVVKWIGERPVVGVCTDCGLEFKVPVQSVSRVSDAQESLKSQFAKHKCAAIPEDSNGGAEPTWL